MEEIRGNSEDVQADIKVEIVIYICYKILGKECELLIFFSEVQLVAALPLVPSKLWLDG